MTAAVKSCLHLVTGPGREAVEDCLAHSAAGDSVLFLDAGVLHLLRADAGGLGGAATAVWFSAADLEAHGLSGLAQRTDVQRVDDAGICALIRAHDHCLSWT